VPAGAACACGCHACPARSQGGPRQASAPGRSAAGGDDTGSPHTAWAAESDAVVTDALAGFDALYRASLALAQALASAGAMSAAARLAQQFADARGPREREDRACRAVSCLAGLPRASVFFSPQVRAVARLPCCRTPQVSAATSPSVRFKCGCGAARGPHCAARRPACARMQGPLGRGAAAAAAACGLVPSGPRASAVDQLADMAAFAALYEHSTAEEVAEEAQPEAGLEDLRLRTPALRPVGCWCTGCAPLSPRAASRSALTFCRIPDS